MCLRARMYDPVTGRFLQRDTMLGRLAAPASLNRFGYAHSNPVRFIDPSGHSTRDALVAACREAWGGDYPCE